MLGQQLKLIRTYNDIKQKDLSKTLNVSRSTYSGWENGTDSIPLLKLNSFCNYFNISLDYICGLTDKKNYLLYNKEIDTNILANNIKNLRKEKKLTQQFVANKIHVSQSVYSKYELGKVLILTYTLIELAKFYNVSIDYICGKKKNMKIEK